MPHSPNVNQCFLCGQIAGDASRDLLAQMLPSHLYRRRVILENETFAVIPSLGALSPGHVLLCPKVHVKSLAQLGSGLAGNVEGEYSDLKMKLRRLLETHYDADVHYFEHGMATVSSHIPCTTEHAHLHFIPVPRSVAVVANEGGTWSTCNKSLTAIAAYTGDQEYLLHETPDGVTRIATGPAGSFPSQSMRRLFASRLGYGDLWNWRTSPRPESADKTWRALQQTAAANEDESADAQVLTTVSVT